MAFLAQIFDGKSRIFFAQFVLKSNKKSNGNIEVLLKWTENKDVHPCSEKSTIHNITEHRAIRAAAMFLLMNAGITEHSPHWEVDKE